MSMCSPASLLPGNTRIATQLTVRVTWDSGDVDLFVKEAIEMWDTQQ